MPRMQKTQFSSSVLHTRLLTQEMRIYMTNHAEQYRIDSNAWQHALNVQLTAMNKAD